MTILQYGCECDSGCGIHNQDLSDEIGIDPQFGTAYRCKAKDAPVVSLVERRGKIMKVCSRCQLTSCDKVLKMLCSTDMSGEDLEILYSYDSLFGMIQLLGNSIDEGRV